MQIISVANQKGGVSKTSTCLHLAGGLARLGLRVLLVDNDPQASLSRGLIGPAALAGLDPACTILSAYDEPGGVPLVDLVIETAIEGISLVPGSPSLAAYNVPDPDAGSCPDLRAYLAGQDGGPDAYDFAFVDCPASLMGLTWAALMASDGVLVPVVPDAYGVQSLIEVRAFVNNLRAEVNPGLGLVGYLLSQVARRNAVHLRYGQMLRDAFPGDVFEAEVRRLAAYGNAIEARLPVSHFDARSDAAGDMMRVTSEFLARCEAIGVAEDGGEVTLG